MNILNKVSVFLLVFIMTMSASSAGAAVEPEENDWAKVNFAGFTLARGSEPSKVKLSWTFILKLKKNNITSIKVYDITDEDRLLIKDIKVTTEDNKWVGRSEEIEIDKDSDHWLFSSDDTEKVFSIQMMDAEGNKAEITQETEHSGQDKATTLKVLM